MCDPIVDVEYPVRAATAFVHGSSAPGSSLRCRADRTRVMEDLFQGSWMVRAESLRRRPRQSPGCPSSFGDRPPPSTLRGAALGFDVQEEAVATVVRPPHPKTVRAKKPHPEEPHETPSTARPSTSARAAHRRIEDPGGSIDPHRILVPGWKEMQAIASPTGLHRTIVRHVLRPGWGRWARLRS